MEDATHKFKPYVQSLQTAVIVHLCIKSSNSLSTSGEGAATVAEVVPTGAGDTPRVAGPDPGRTTGTVLALYVNTVGEPYTTPGKSIEP